jgi:hypothetical protein
LTSRSALVDDSWQQDNDMALFRQPGPTTPPADSCSVPPRTPGPLGINDQGDPNVTTLLGDTPGPVGMSNGADPSLPQFCLADPYADLVCRADDGVPLSVGFDQAATPAAKPAAPSVSLADAQEIALKITTYFEGGRSMNYQALADDFDGQGTSFGLIQWNFGTNTLGPLLKKMIDLDATAFQNCFDADADHDTLKKALTDKKKDDQLKWARDKIKNKRTAWESAFTKIGSNDTFNRIQREQAAGQYHPKSVTVIKKLREISPTLFTNVEVRCYAAIFDLCVQQGGIDKAVTEIKKRVTDEKPATQLDLMKIVVTETAAKAKNQWVSDCLSRRMGILTAAPYKSKEHDVTATRKNIQFTLISESGEKVVANL